MPGAETLDRGTSDATKVGLGRGASPAGPLLTLGAFLLWGVLPLYWKLLQDVPETQVLAHRILWSAVLTGTLSLFWFRRELRAALASWASFRPMLLGGALLGLNWFAYIYAVSNGHVVEASMGYYINPLFSVVLGVVVLRERLGRGEWTAVVLAAIGVIVLGLRLSRPPWIALTLTATFGIYGLVKKRTRVAAVPALAVESASLAPVALLYLVLTPGTGDLVTELSTGPLLVGAGLVTALPLYLFAEGARRIMLSLVGFMQYIAPTITLAIGVLVFDEAFTLLHLLGFAFIWAGIVTFSIARYRKTASTGSPPAVRRPS
jgi:chloramphenicol-sensitive protein RarD